jgi:hypothetical protein
MINWTDLCGFAAEDSDNDIKTLGPGVHCFGPGPFSFVVSIFEGSCNLQVVLTLNEILMSLVSLLDDMSAEHHVF